jgi:hypothetical protein
MDMAEEKQERKTRSDKGLVMATRRDLYCIEWIAEQYAARFDQIRILLSRFPDRERPFKNGLMSDTTLKDQLSRWRRAGWIESRRTLADEPAYVWVTKKGLQLVGLDDIYKAAEPASTRLNHIYAVNQVRLWMDYKFAWKSERRYRSEKTAQLKKGDKLGPIPDGLAITKDGVAAVEVEITSKKPADVFAKLVRLVREYEYVNLNYQPVFYNIWFYVPNEKIEALIESAAEGLRDEEADRVSVYVEHDLRASRSR